MPEPEPVRFADILTTASAIANYLGQPTVTARHLLDAIAIQTGAATMDDLGRAVSPLVRRPAGQGGDVEPAVRELVQRWFAGLGDAHAPLSEPELAAFAAELAALLPDG